MTTAAVDRRAAELDWWTRYLDHPTANQRMWALYGARYMPFFYDEMIHAGSTIEIGSGPLPVMEIMECASMTAVDVLADEYRGLTGWPIARPEQIDVKGRWQTVLLLNVLDHADNPRELAELAHRLVRPGGRVLVYVQIHEGDERHDALTVEQVRGWLVDAGLHIGRETMIEQSFDPPAWACVAHRVAIDDGVAFGTIVDALDQSGARWWLACGTALGYRREGKIIEWDHDVDVGVDAAQADPRAIRERLEAAGWECWRRLGSPSDGYIQQYQHPLWYRLLDVYWYYGDGREAWQTVYPVKGRRRYVWPADVLERLEVGTMYGQDVLVPPVEYLDALYGDWRTPREAWDWSSDPLNLR